MTVFFFGLLKVFKKKLLGFLRKNLKNEINETEGRDLKGNPDACFALASGVG